MASAGSAIAEYQGAQQRYADGVQRHQQNVANTLAAQRDEQRQLTLRQMQEQEAHAQKNRIEANEGAQREAQINVAAADANVSGVSVDSLMADVARSTQENMVTNTKNWEMTAQQLQSQQDATVTRAQSRINSVPMPAEPSPLGMGASILGAGVKAYGMMK